MVGGTMSSVKNMSRWTMNAHQQRSEIGMEANEILIAPVGVLEALPGSGGVGEREAPWTCPEPVLYDEDEDEDEEEEAFGDDEEFADDEEFDEEDDDFLEDEDEEFEEEGEEDEEDEDDDEF